jgi:spore germination protein (amino acid permease)
MMEAKGVFCMSQQIKETYKVAPFLVFFLVASAQIGVGILGFERILVKEAGYDGWVGIVTGGAMVNLSIFLMYRLLKEGRGNLVYIHQNLFGKWIGNGFNLLLSAHFLNSAYTVLRTYIEVLQVWMFPSMPSWFPALFFLLLAYYIISSGFQVITGVCYFGVILPFWLFITLVYPMEYAHFDNLLPMFSHSVKELWGATASITLSYIGYETLLIYYPFIQQPEKSHKYAQLGALFTSFVYLAICLVSFVFFSEKQLLVSIWPYLTMSKVLEFSFLQRFEYVQISFWLFVIMPNIVLFFWSASRIVRDVAKMKQRFPLIGMMLLFFVYAYYIDDRAEVNFINEWNGKIGFYFIYVYIPLLYVVQRTVNVVRSRKQ